MSLGPESFTYQWTLDDGREALMRRAGLDDLGVIRELYFETYGDRYGLPEVVDDERSFHVLTDPTWFWLLTEVEGRVVASLIFGLESRHRLGKTFGGVVTPDLRGHKLMQVMLREGLATLLRDGGPVDLIYAVVRTFVSLTFHRDLKELGFVDTGIFPNVRKVQRYETHGLKVCMGQRSLSDRRKTPRLIPEFGTLYEITRQRLGLEEAERVSVPRKTVTWERMPLEVVAEVGRDGVTAARIKFLWRSSRHLRHSFFPLHLPTTILSDPSGRVRVFLCLQSDGHGSVLGVRFGGMDPVRVLLSVADYCEERGAVYLELLVSAYLPELQEAARAAGFLPCAYFPSAELHPREGRQDVVITSKTFVPLHFRGLKLTEDSKPYLLEFYKNYTSSLWEELMDA